jgi:exonuclease VII large subunit
MEKGYAMVRDSRTGTLIRSAGETDIGKRLSIGFLEDSLEARVEEIYHEEL